MSRCKEIDELISMARSLFDVKGRIIIATPEYRRFHDSLTEFVYKNHLDECSFWKTISNNLIYKSTQYLIAGELNDILDALEQIKRMLLKREYDPIWRNIHPYIAYVSKPKFNIGEYADAVESAFKEINVRVKCIVENKRGEEYDGADLMRKCFSPKNPVVILDNINSESGRNVQEGYMEMFAGAMIGIRNPKAHGYQDLSKGDAVRKLHFASMLMYKIDGAIDRENRR